MGRFIRQKGRLAWTAAAGATTFAAAAAGWASFTNVGRFQLAFASLAAVIVAGATFIERREHVDASRVESATAASIEPESASPPAQAWNIPARNPAFTGRASLLAELAERFTDQATLPVALHGMGGVGKTQLAIEYAHRHADRYDIAWWVAAEHAELVPAQLAALAQCAGWATADIDTRLAAQLAVSRLHQRSGWLLIIDNAEQATTIREWLPGGQGHVLITTRLSSWADVAIPLHIPVLDRADSTMLLRRQTSSLSADDADALSEALGDLPLALTHALGTLAETGIPAATYLQMLALRAGDLLDSGAPAGYPRSLAAATRLSAARLAESSADAATLLQLCALVAAEPVPIPLLIRMVEQTAKPGPERPWWTLVSQISKFGLARVDTSGLQLHRVTQAILRNSIDESQQPQIRTHVAGALAAAHPGDPSAPSTWPAWSSLLPHLLEVDPAIFDSVQQCGVACDGAFYLLARGDYAASHHLATRLYEHWRSNRHADDTGLLRASEMLALGCRGFGQFELAAQLDGDIAARRGRLLGPRHADTLAAAHNLAIDYHSLGRIDDAIRLNQATLDVRREVLGERHHDTLASSSNLAYDLYAIGDIDSAVQLNRETLARRESTLGTDHPDTLTSANNLGVTLRAQPDLAAARQLHETTLTRRRQVLGNDHPSTLTSMNNLAVTLRAAGKPIHAREMHQQVYRRRQLLFGDDHHDTLTSANNLAIALHGSGDPSRAAALLANILTSRQRRLGADHPDTLAAATDRAVCLRAAGEVNAARQLHQETLARCVRVLGPSHPITLRSASNLAYTLAIEAAKTRQPPATRIAVDDP